MGCRCGGCGPPLDAEPPWEFWRPEPRTVGAGSRHFCRKISGFEPRTPFSPLGGFHPPCGRSAQDRTEEPQPNGEPLAMWWSTPS